MLICSTAVWIPDNAVHSNFTDLCSKPSAEEGITVDSSSIPNNDYPVKKYSKLNHLFNAHSWLPYYSSQIQLNPAPYNVLPGVTIYSQNLLGTAVTYGGAAWVIPGNNLLYYLGFNYLGFYPILNAEGTCGGFQTIYKPSDIAYYNSVQPAQNLKFRTYVPLNFSRGKYNIYIYPEYDLTGSNTETYNLPGNDFQKGFFSSLYRVQVYDFFEKAYRDIIPKYGIGADLDYINYPLNNKFFGDSYYGLVTGCLPGIVNHQGIRITVGGDLQNAKQYYVSGLLRPSRGYDYDPAIYNLTEIYSRTGKLTFDYYTPLFYPDLSIFDILYISRFWTNIYYDLSFVDYPNMTTANISRLNLASAGFELSMNFNVFHSQIPFSITSSQAYLIGYKKFTWWLSYNISLLNF